MTIAFDECVDTVLERVCDAEGQTAGEIFTRAVEVAERLIDAREERRFSASDVAEAVLNRLSWRV